PESMIARGCLARICSVVSECGTTSESTRASRTRRAMSCAYCAPKSTTRTGRWSVSFTRQSLRGCSACGSGCPVRAGAILVTLARWSRSRDRPRCSGAVLVLQRGPPGQIALDGLLGPALPEEREHRDHAEEHQQQHPRQGPAHLHPHVEREHHVDHVDQAVDRGPGLGDLGPGVGGGGEQALAAE